ncbi:MAG: cytochrome c [Pyrinomonadaceae bacterium]
MRQRTGIALILTLILAIGCVMVSRPAEGEQGQRDQQGEPFDPPQFYSKNCLGCHGSKAQKNFNTELPEGQMVDAIVNGFPMPEPPDMPAFAEKGINEERAKALITHMKSLHREP